MITKKICLILLLISGLISCRSILLDRPDKDNKKLLAKASPEFRQGWEDGCETGMSAGTNTFYKVFYHSNKADGYKMADSSEYKSAWGNAFWYCYRYDYIKTKSSIHSAFFGGLR